LESDPNYLVLSKSSFPLRLKNASLLPLKKSGVDLAGTAETLVRQRFPLATSSQNKDDRLKYEPDIFGFSPAAALVGVRLIGQALTSRD
jgi:hypothetical protein